MGNTPERGMLVTPRTEEDLADVTVHGLLLPEEGYLLTL